MKERLEKMKEEEAKLKELEANSKDVEPGKEGAETFEDMDEDTRNRLIEEQRQARIALEADAKRRAAYEADLEK